ncbi:holo-ACP synthase [Paenibacillus eucommiae]|uniref:Holo-[acyl-carrier-protein] synthase n=1 Tax=Paenibacillus eucommiae TaxID=1355755 RepID=A0ABS4ISX9_9BACL|nr:holo-ACP synthase [Paenibacillus eucommiae]MBP1989981.1 holo-[acyl-carrier protein] synthase [Paenibacillus eucommiae]
MIVGLGTDLVEISRIEKILRRTSRLFLRRLLSEKELAALDSILDEQRKAEWVAGRFAAKEAFVKALGTGISGLVPLSSIDISTDGSHRLSVKVPSNVYSHIGHRVQCHLSITHTSMAAEATVVLELA